MKLHRLTKPFERGNTKLWRERERIRNSLEQIRDNADEAFLLLEAGDLLEGRLPRASVALKELQTAVKELGI